MPKRRLSSLMILTIVVLFAFGSFSSSAAPPSSAAISAAPSSNTQPPRTLIRNASLMLTMDPLLGEGPLGLLRDADILLENDRILAVGENLQAEQARVIDASGKIVMPGFVDVHNHLWQSLIRGCGTEKDLVDWLNACIFPFNDSGISEEDAYAAVRLSTADLLQTGVTTAVDWSHAYNDDFVRGNLRALNDSGLRYVFAFWVNQADAAKRFKQELIDPNPLASMHVATHPSPGLEGHVAESVELAHELGVPLNVHLLEDSQQRAEDPIGILEAAGTFEKRVTLFANHSVHLSDDEIAFLSSHDARIAHNPLSNMRLASGVIRLGDMHQSGLKIGLGLDGGTNDTSDMFNDMRAAVGLQRAKYQTPAVYPSVPDVLRLATIEGARTLGMEDQIGSLTPGKQADLIIINPAMINFAPEFDWVSQLVFNGQPVNVEWVFVAGRVRKHNGKLVGVNPDQLVQAAEEAVLHIKEILGK